MQLIDELLFQDIWYERIFTQLTDAKRDKRSSPFSVFVFVSFAFMAIFCMDTAWDTNYQVIWLHQLQHFGKRFDHTLIVATREIYMHEIYRQILSLHAEEIILQNSHLLT